MQKVARYIVLGSLFIIPFLVLYVSNSLFFPFITGKGFAFRVLVEIAAAAFLVLALMDAKYRPRFSWTLVLYGALVVWMAIADAFAVSPLKAFWSNFERMDGWITLVHVFLFFGIAATVLSAENLWRKWWLTFLSSSLLVSLYGLMQLWGVFQIHQGGVRLDATLGNAEYLAGYLLFAIAIALWQAIESRGWMRYALYALAALHIIILFFTATRGAILGAVGAALLGAILWMIEAGKNGRRAAAIVLGVLIVLIGGFFALKHSAFVQNEPTLSRLASISLSEGQTRFTIWHMAYEGFLARPVTGWGQEGFNYVFNTYYEPSLYGQEAWFDRAHNLFLDWLSAGGAPALLLFLALLISAIIALYRAGTSRAERVVLISALAAYAFQGLFVFDNLFTYIPLAALLGLAHAASARPFARLESMRVLPENTAMTLGAPIAIVALVLVFWFVDKPNIAAAHDLILALTPSSDPMDNLNYFKQAIADHSYADQEIREQLVSYAASVASAQSVSTDTKTAIITYALDQMKQEVAARPADARILLEYSLAFRAAGDAPDAAKAAAAALALSPKKQGILFEKGTIEWQAGDAADARADFDAAYALETQYDDAAVYAAAGHIISGDIPGGKDILMKHFGTTAVDNDVLAVAYYQAHDNPDIIPILEAIASSTPSADNEYRLASGYALVGRYAEAKNEILKAMHDHPETGAQGQALLKQVPGQ